eukprot:1161643-Pelagomonas_calceolata.AAC.13
MKPPHMLSSVTQFCKHILQRARCRHPPGWSARCRLAFGVCPYAVQSHAAPPAAASARLGAWRCPSPPALLHSGSMSSSSVNIGQ